jgi:hypothetical protein
MQNMKLDISNNGSKRILNYIMCGNAFSPNKINVTHQIYGLANMHQEKPQAMGSKGGSI